MKSLESAKLLAENLLDTISMECGASRYVSDITKRKVDEGGLLYD